MVDAYKGRRGARDEDTDLINGIVGAVKGAVLIKGGRLEGEEQRGRDALVDCVLGNVDEEKRQHTRGR